jgi:ribonuclease E
VLRLIDEESAKKRSGEVRAVVSPDMSIFLLNERRPRVNEIEERTGVRIVVVSDPTRSDNRFEVTRLRDDDKKLKDSASYEIQDQVESTQQQISNNKKKVRIESPAVNIKPHKKPKRKKDGFIKRLLKSLTSSKEEEKIVPKKSNNQRRNNRRPNQNRNQSRPNQNNTRNNNRDNKTPDNRKKTDNKKPISPKPQSKDEKEKQEKYRQTLSDLQMFPLI